MCPLWPLRSLFVLVPSACVPPPSGVCAKLVLPQSSCWSAPPLLSYSSVSAFVHRLTCRLILLSLLFLCSVLVLSVYPLLPCSGFSVSLTSARGEGVGVGRGEERGGKRGGGRRLPVFTLHSRSGPRAPVRRGLGHRPLWPCWFMPALGLWLLAIFEGPCVVPVLFLGLCCLRRLALIYQRHTSVECGPRNGIRTYPLI